MLALLTFPTSKFLSEKAIMVDYINYLVQYESVFLSRDKLRLDSNLQSAKRLWAKVFLLLCLCLHPGAAFHGHGVSENLVNTEKEGMFIALVTG